MDAQEFLTTVGGVYGNGIGSASPAPGSVARTLDVPFFLGDNTRFLEKVGDSTIDIGVGAPGSDFTITCFVRPTFLATAVIAGYVILKSGSAGVSAVDTEFGLYLNSTSDKAGITISDGVSFYTVETANNSMVNNAWHFLEVTYTVSTQVLTIAINHGTPVTLSSVPYPQNIAADVRVGFGSGSAGFSGQLAMIGLWTRKLSASELASVYNLGIGKLYSQLTAGEKVSAVAYFELDELSDGSGAVTRVDSVQAANLTDPDHLSSSTQIPN